MPLTGPDPIAANHVRAGFDCGQAALDRWLVARAIKNERKGASRTHVLSDREIVVAYYCLSAGSVAQGSAPGRIRRNVPDPIPVMLLGRLAVAQSHQGRRLARAPVRDAFLRTSQAADIAGIRALLVHALDEEAVRFYRHLGFIGSPVDPHTLMLRLTTAVKALGK